jgi:hypothetical protein
VKAVHVLFGPDFLGHLVGRNVPGQRQLHDEAVDVGVAVDVFHDLQEFGFGDGVGVAEQRRLEAYFPAGFYLVAHVGFAAPVVAHQHGGQVRRPAPFGREGLYLPGNFVADVLGDLFTVYQLHAVCLGVAQK